MRFANRYDLTNHKSIDKSINSVGTQLSHKQLDLFEGEFSKLMNVEEKIELLKRLRKELKFPTI